MATVGQRFKTGETCPTRGSYIFDGYTDNTTTPAPTSEERVIQLNVNATFPPIRSSNKGAYWKLARIL
ncbi:YjzC family protein [Myxococcus faecalis]|uniref:YjzC family protein n=1 Tax=Myxococcus TaxID=32 RepID=UPI001CBBC3E5|nr:YjzC family protein [Myxococcus sp. XM-1-1-1]